eukprot:2407702-Amphidinium_carterae.4
MQGSSREPWSRGATDMPAICNAVVGHLPVGRCKWTRQKWKWRAREVTSEGEKGGREGRPPDSLRSWPGLDRSPPTWGGNASITRSEGVHTHSSHTVVERQAITDREGHGNKVYTHRAHAKNTHTHTHGNVNMRDAMRFRSSPKVGEQTQALHNAKHRHTQYK